MSGASYSYLVAVVAVVELAVAVVTIVVEEDKHARPVKLLTYSVVEI